MWPHYNGKSTADDEKRTGEIKADSMSSDHDLRNSMWMSRQSVNYLKGVVRSAKNNGPMRRSALEAMHLNRVTCRTAAMALRIRNERRKAEASL